MVQHIVGDAVPKLNTPYECGMEPSMGCRDLLGIWQVGLQGECMHPDAGFRFGKNGYRHLALQVCFYPKQFLSFVEIGYNHIDI